MSDGRSGFVKLGVFTMYRNYVGTALYRDYIGIILRLYKGSIGTT